MDQEIPWCFFLIVYLGSSLLLTVTNEPSLGLFSYLLIHAKKTDIVLIAICYEFKKTMEKFMMSQFLGL